MRLQIPWKKAKSGVKRVKSGFRRIRLKESRTRDARKMDMMIMIPKEGFAFSRDPKVQMKAPKFDASNFVLNDGYNKVSVTMKYVL